MKRWLTVPLAVIVASGLIVGIGSVSVASAKGLAKGLTTKHPFKIFSPQDKTGPTAGIGAFWGAGLRAAVKYVNAHGGILGRKVVVTFQDDHSVPQTATTITTSALAGGTYQAVIPSSAQAGAIIQVTKRNHILEVGAGGFHTQGNGAKYPYLFSMNPPQTVQAVYLACLTETTYHPKSVAYLYVNTTTFPSSIPGLTAVFHHYGTKVVAQEPFTFAATTIQPQVGKIQAAKPTVLVVGAFFGSLAVAIKGLNAANYTVPIAANTESTANSPKSFLSATTTYPKHNIGEQWAPNSRINNKLSAAQKKAVTALKGTVKSTAYPVVQATYLYTYDALMYIKWAATHAHSTKTPAMAKALESLAAHPSTNTGGLMVKNPLFSKTTHWFHTPYYNVTVQGTFTGGTFPTKGNGKPIPACINWKWTPTAKG